MTVPVRFTATLESPLIVGARRRATVTPTLDHIPGSVLRGALASAWLRERGRDDDFERLFTSDRDRYPFLRHGDEWRAIPLTTFGCKTKGLEHRGVDTLLAASRDGVTAVPTACVEPGCHQPVKRLRGFVGAKGAELADVPRDQVVGVGIDRTTGGVKDGVLFEHEYVDCVDAAGQVVRLTGTGYVEEDDVGLIEALVRRPLFAGKARSRGYGRFSLEVSRESVTTPDARLRDFASAAGGGDRRWSLTLQSPTILVDRFLRNTTDVQDELSRLVPETRVVEQWVETQLVSGWNAATRLPKPDELALSPGSTFLLESGCEQSKIVEGIARLERRGLGLRTGQGFGQVFACDPTHVRLQERT